MKYDATVFPGQESTDYDDAKDDDKHGTCMASHVGGRINGVYKDAIIVPVKMMKYSNRPAKVRDVMEALGWILTKTGPLNGIGVLSMSFGEYWFPEVLTYSLYGNY